MILMMIVIADALFFVPQGPEEFSQKYICFFFYESSEPLLIVVQINSAEISSSSLLSPYVCIHVEMCVW